MLCSDDTIGYDASQNRGDVKPLDVQVEFGNMYTKEITYFGEAVAGTREIPITAADAIASQKVVEAAYSSNQRKTYQQL